MISSDKEFIILNHIDIKYSIDKSAFEKFATIICRDVDELISRLMEKGCLKMEDDKLLLTDQGKKAVKNYRISILKTLNSDARKKIEEINEEMNEAGHYLRFTVVRYQLRADGMVRIIESLQKAHDEIRNLVERLSEVLPHFKHYVKRLEEAFNEIKKGDDLYIVWHPNSYYNVYSEMRADLANILEESKKLE